MKRFLVVAAGLLLTACSSDESNQAGHDAIARVEPPFWWTGFKHTELQLLVHAGDIAGYMASVSAPGVSVSRVEHGDSPNYLFVYLDIEASTRAGTFDIEFDNGEEGFAYAYELRERQPVHVGTYDSSDVIYLITPDRFANGDPLNDNVDGYEDEADRNDDYGRHGGDLEGIRQHLDYIADTGFTQVWINPLLENAMSKRSYHG